MSIPYWQVRQKAKLTAGTNMTGRAIPRNREKCKITLSEKEAKELKIKDSKSLEQKKCKDATKKNKKPAGQVGQKQKAKKKIKSRTKKQAKKMRQLAKINKEMLGDPTSDIKELCEIQSPVCTMFATVLNHDAGRVGDQLLNRDDMTKCCPPCNGYIEEHPDFAGGRFKKRRHGAVIRPVIK